MDWNRMRDQIGWALTGVESYEHREARLSEDTPERILQDLIAELRNKHCAEPESRLQCQWCESDWPCPEARAADRAKQRLREVSGE